EKMKKNPFWKELIIILIAPEKNPNWKVKALELKVHDYYVYPFPAEHLIERLNFLVKFKFIKPQLSALEHTNVLYQFPLSKRLLDIFVSTTALIIASPLMLLVALLVKLTSKGPVIYKSKRVGTGYNVFNFYKFRSMYVDADSRLKEFEKLNKYGANENGESTFI